MKNTSLDTQTTQNPPAEGSGQDYWQTVKLIAQEVCESHEPDSVHEHVEGSEWVIYTWRNLRVIQHTDNEEAAFEDGALDTGQGFASLMSSIAYHAMYADVYDMVSTLEDN